MTGLDKPVAVAMIGAGNRSTNIYQELLQSLHPWLNLVAVCDPVKENADRYAQNTGVQAFYAVSDLIEANLIEAALVVAPIDVHHAISVTLSRAGIHHLVETSMASTLWQARDMAREARRNGVILRIGENFVRLPFDRLARAIDQTGFLGPIRRITCLYDHPGYHNNSRWIAFYQAHPTAVQAVKHQMVTEPHWEARHRYHEDESFRCHLFFFPEDRLVTDLAGNLKGMLGRYPRPGYTELAGTRGTIVRDSLRGRQSLGEVRYCSDESLQHGARHDMTFPIEHVVADGHWQCDRIDLPIGMVEYRNEQLVTIQPERAYALSSVASHVTDFTAEVRGSDHCEFSLEDAVMSMEMEVGCRESALQEGQRLALPLADLDIESEATCMVYITPRL